MCVRVVGSVTPRSDLDSRAVVPRGSETVLDVLTARAEAMPEAPAVLSPGRKGIENQELLVRLSAVDASLAAHGIGRGDRVLVVAGLGPDAAVAILGAANRATCVPVSPSATAELGAALDEADAGALLVPRTATVAERLAAADAEVALVEVTEDAWGMTGASRPNLGDAPCPDDIAFILRTSGTTSRPKLVPATHRQLLARAEAAADFLRLGSADRCFCPMPLCYGHGLYTGLMIPLLSGGSAILPHAFDQESTLTSLDHLAATWYTAGAAHQAAILGWLRAGRARSATSRLRFARCASAALPEGLRDGLEEELGVPVLETYGTSETGMIASPDPDGPRKAGTSGVAVGVEMAIADGEILVRGPTVFSGYEADPALTERSFDGEWFRTGDRGSLDEDGFLTVEGRLDDVINRGGEKVSPAEVESVLLGHPDVAQAVVFGAMHPSLGQEVAAAISPEPESALDEAEIRSYVAERLAPFKVPRRLAVLPEIRVGPTGKAVRTGLADTLRPTAGAGHGGAREGNRGRVETTLVRAFAAVLALEVGADDDFFERGGDSLAAVELLAMIEQELHVEVDLEDLVSAPTPRLLAATILRDAHPENESAGAGRDVIGVNLDGCRPPLFVVGGRPGYAVRVLVMARQVADDQPVHGLQPPNMDWHAAGHRTIPEMAAHYLRQVREIRPDGPHRILGSSFGGLIVFEMARQLEEAGSPAEFIGLVDTEPPAMAWLPETGDLSHALEDLDAPEALSGAVASAGERVAAAHIEARRSYVAASPLRGELTLFYCAGEGVAAGGDRRRLWAKATTSRFNLVELPGFHARFDREPQLSLMRDSLRLCLAGETPTSLRDPASVFDRVYHLIRERGSERIRDRDGSVFRVEPGVMAGRVRASRERRGKLLLRGWASDAAHRRAGETVVAFVGGRYVGYSTCGAPTGRLQRRYSAPGLRNAGFRMRLELTPQAKRSERARIFALSPDGRASELEIA